MKILVRGFLHCPLVSIDVGNCRLGNGAGKALGYFLLNNSGSLKSIELADNRLITAVGWQAIGYGIQEYSGELEYLGMAGNAVGEAGIVAIGGGICDLEQIRRLDISRIELDGEASFRIVQMVGFHKRLEWLDMSAVWLGAALGETLIEAVTDHWGLRHLAVGHCGLTENQQRKLRLLVERNGFYADNPCLRKDKFTADDSKEIDEWIVKIKNPILAKVLAQQKTENPCEYDPVASVAGKQIPKFIKSRQHKVPDNSELLNTYYIDCFGAESDMYMYDPLLHNETTEEGRNVDEVEFHYNPNEFNENEYLEDVLLGTHAEMSVPYYF